MADPPTFMTPEHTELARTLREQGKSLDAIAIAKTASADPLPVTHSSLPCNSSISWGRRLAVAAVCIGCGRR